MKRRVRHKIFWISFLATALSGQAIAAQPPGNASYPVTHSISSAQPAPTGLKIYPPATSSGRTATAATPMLVRPPVVTQAELADHIEQAHLLATRPAHPAVFGVPLMRTSATSAAEDSDLTATLDAYEKRKDRDDFSSLQSFVNRHPDSGWDTSILTNLGVSYYHDGDFSMAIAAWSEAWKLGGNAEDPQVRLIVDSDIGDLARSYAYFGQTDELRKLFIQIGKRRIVGSATEAVQDAMESMTIPQRDKIHPFNCGPVALKTLILAENPKDTTGANLPFYPSGADGTNLAQLRQIGSKLGFDSKIVMRKPGQAVPIPAIVHWQLGHFATVIAKIQNTKTGHVRYEVEDPGLPNGDMWVTQSAIDTEASDLYLVPADMPMQQGWSLGTATAATALRGRGPTGSVAMGDAGDPLASGGPNNCPMCIYGIKAATVGLYLSDQPVGYTPPFGPSPKILISYNQREDSQPATFGFSNLGQKWTMNFIDYITDDPNNPGANVSRYLPGGGAYYYTGYGGNGKYTRFAIESDDKSILTFDGNQTYTRLLADGSTEIYAQSNGAQNYPREIFLSQIIDPQGNTLTLNYDGQMRLVSLTDATGRQTTFSYNYPNQPFLITSIADPFGRSATLTYDAYGRLSSITDILGLTSSFVYDQNSLVDSMTTAYGTTNFTYTAPGSSGPPRFLDIADPMGYHEREEWVEPAPVPSSDPASQVPTGMPVNLVNQYLQYRDSFHWDKNAYIQAGCSVGGGCDYTKAVDWHFCHVPNTNIKSTTIEAIKNPLENRIWFNYPGQNQGSFYAGVIDTPEAIGRVVDDGSSQITQRNYNQFGFYPLITAIDPLGRTTYFGSPNQIDLTGLSQLTGYAIPTTIAQFQYNYEHRPVAYTDASGQTTFYTYNPAGQVTSITNALKQTTSYNYDANGDLTSIVNANGATSATFSYDNYDLVASYTDSEGWTAAYSYDAADRLTQIAYPDGTSDSFGYNRLDLTSYRDRLARNSYYSYDADRRMVSSTDPAGQQSLYGYGPTDQITSFTDPKGNVTQWAYDIEDRLASKTYADNSKISYAYNLVGLLASRTDALDQVVTYQYYEDNTLADTNYENTGGNSRFYDLYYLRLIGKNYGSNDIGGEVYIYGNPGSLGALQVAQRTDYNDVGFTQSSASYTYDALGRMSSRTLSGQQGSPGDTESFAYDNIGRLTTDTNDLGTFNLSYLGQSSQITSRLLSGSNFGTTWSYLPKSEDRRLSGISTTGLTAGQTTGFQFNSNAEGEITSQTQSSDVAVSYPPSQAQQNAAYNNLNQLTGLQNPPPDSQTLSYDANGNLKSDGTRNFTYDAENRVIGIAYANNPGQSSSFVYDDLGRIVQDVETPSGGGQAVTTNYFRCGDQVCQTTDDASGNVDRRYFSEGEYSPAATNPSAYYAQDQLGSVRRVFTAGSSPSYDYDPYGVPLQNTAPLTDYGYADMLFHSQSGFDLAVNRAYDPAIGRWISRDPLGEEPDPEGNLYAYVGGDPINQVDPSGDFPDPFDLAIGTIAGSIYGAIGADSPDPSIPGIVSGVLIGGIIGFGLAFTSPIPLGQQFVIAGAASSAGDTISQISNNFLYGQKPENINEYEIVGAGVGGAFSQILGSWMTIASPSITSFSGRLILSIASGGPGGIMTITGSKIGDYENMFSCKLPILPKLP